MSITPIGRVLASRRHCLAKPSPGACQLALRPQTAPTSPRLSLASSSSSIYGVSHRRAPRMHISSSSQDTVILLQPCVTTHSSRGPRPMHCSICIRILPNAPHVQRPHPRLRPPRPRPSSPPPYARPGTAARPSRRPRRDEQTYDRLGLLCPLLAPHPPCHSITPAPPHSFGAAPRRPPRA